jgi:hypothetical protein
VTAIMVLSTNGMCAWHNGHDILDMRLVDNALQTLEDIIDESDSDKLRSYRDACVELSDGAKKRVSLRPTSYV